MASMSGHNSTSSLQGFSVFQPALGSTLQWLPALGSHELDELVHSFLPGPASIQDKRAHISMDFYEFSRQTGETFKFYPVYTASFGSMSTASPASSSAMHDSGYGSSFDVSPVVSSMSPWTPSLSASTPASTASDSRTNQRTTSNGARKPLDFSSYPGMRILTKDGRDITNSASRGCKSKEQRDHAHLMRILKACDACRRKKIRCDPSHKKRTASQPQPIRSDAKPAKKAKTAKQPSPSPDSAHPSPDFVDFVPSFDTGMTPADAFDDLNQNPDDFWQQFVHFDDQHVAFPGEYGFSLDPSGYVTTSHASSSVSPVVSTPAVPGGHGLRPDVATEEPALPYLDPAESYGTNYQDFNLYSPPAELEGLDEDWQSVRKPRRRTHTSKQDNMLESSFSHSTPEPPNIHGSAHRHSGQNHQHGELLLDAGAFDWPRVPSEHIVHGMHSTDATVTHSDNNALITRGDPSRPHRLPSPSLGYTQLLSLASTSGHREVLPLDPGTQAAALATSTRRPTAPASPDREHQASASASGLTGRQYSASLIDGHGTLHPPPQAGHGAPATLSTGLPRASTQLLAHSAGDASPTAARPQEGGDQGVSAPARQQAASPTVRGDVVAPDRAPSSSLLARFVTHGSGGNHEPDNAHNAEGPSVGAGLRLASHARYAPSASGVSDVHAGPSAALANVVAPPRSTPQGVPGVSWENFQPSFQGTASPAVNMLVTLGVVFYLSVLLMRWACFGWQRPLLAALALSGSACAYPTHNRSIDGASCAATRATQWLRHSSRGTMASSLLAL